MLWLIGCHRRVSQDSQEWPGRKSWLVCWHSCSSDVSGVLGQGEVPSRTRYLSSHARWHGRVCLGALTALTAEQGDTYGDFCCSSHTFVSHGYLQCGLLVRRLGPCLWAAGTRYHLFFGF